MTLAPLYTPENTRQVAYQLRYTWAAWIRAGQLSHDRLDWNDLDARWETDGLRRLESHIEGDTLQITFSTTPDVSPVLCTQRAKGRLSYACRQAGLKIEFSRKVSLRSLGENCSDTVQQYVARQVESARFADPRASALLNEFAFDDATVNFSTPTETHSGRYWYNLHIVLVTLERGAVWDRETLGILRDTCPRIALKKGHRIAAFSMMPDHLHLSLRANVEDSPADVALGFMNNLAYALGQKSWWQYGYYVGTFGEFSMAAVRPNRNQ